MKEKEVAEKTGGRKEKNEINRKGGSSSRGIYGCAETGKGGAVNCE